MTPFHSRTGLLLSVGYLVLFLLAGSHTIYLLVFHTANSEFSGLLGILLTMPWSPVLIPLLKSSGYIVWYSQFSGHPAVYGFFGVLGLLPAALINAAILYFIGRWLDRALKARER